jgi:hypothetical protein
MQYRLPFRFWIKVSLGTVSAVTLALTLVVPSWMELLFGLAPDAGDSSSEWALVISLIMVTVLMFGFAGRIWTRRVRFSQPP